MFKKFIKSYYHFFDERVKNGTLVVFIITMIILAIWFFAKHEQTLTHIKTSLNEYL